MKFIYELSRSIAKGHSLRGGNEMISANDRLSIHVKADLTAHLRKLSTDVAHETYEHIEMFSEDRTCYMAIVVSPPTKRRMDVPNWYPTVKALIDGLTDAGVFEDDNDNVIKSYMFMRGPVTDNKKYRIELILHSTVRELFEELTNMDILETAV